MDRQLSLQELSNRNAKNNCEESCFGEGVKKLPVERQATEGSQINLRD